MLRNKILLIIALIEILIGAITLTANIISLFLATNTKTPNVFIFIIITAVISASLGVGMLRFNKTAYLFLIYFSSIILLSKLLILTNIITLNGALETSIPSSMKNGASIIYHGFVLYYLTRKDIKSSFVK